jgi:crotonobetainyl-CoA:carnitine CoA-transferase CaiB-like acyl-CoA transferase
MAIKPLSGIRILDATSNIAGPFGGSILADLGAEVTKIEIPSGDPSRSMAPVDGDKSAYFEIVNRNKLVTEIDLKSETGINRLNDLLRDCDVFLTNFLPEQLKILGISADELMLRFPKLIYGNLTSYGSVGKDASSPGYDATVQARTGIMHLTGEAEGDPVRVGVSILDLGAGTWLAMGILAALLERNRTDKGSLVETSLYETGVAWVSYHLSAFQISGNPSVRSGSGHPTFSPYGLFKTSDNDICIGVGSDAVFQRLCTQIGREDLIKNELFVSNVDRVKNRKTLTEEIERALLEKPAAYWAEKLGSNGVPADLLVRPEALFDDPQAKEVGILLLNPDKDSLVKLIPGLPIKFNGQRPEIYRSAPHKEN